MNNTRTIVAATFRSILALCTDGNGQPVSGEPEKDVLEEMPSKGQILEALEVEDRPFELLEAWSVLDEIDLRKEGGTTPDGLPMRRFVVACRTVLRAVENQGKNAWDSKATAQKMDVAVDEIARATKEAKRTAEKAYRKALIARLVELKTVYNPLDSTSKLEEAVKAANGKLPSRQQPKPVVQTPTTPVVVAAAQAPSQIVAPVAAKPVAPRVSPERAELLREVGEYSVTLTRDVTEYSNTELRLHLRHAKGRQAKRVADLQVRWERVNRSKAGRGAQAFPVSPESSTAQVDAAEKRLEAREAFVRGQVAGSKQVERARHGYSYGTPTDGTPTTVTKASVVEPATTTVAEAPKAEEEAPKVSTPPVAEATTEEATNQVVEPQAQAA